MTSKEPKSCQIGSRDPSDMRIRQISPSIDQLSNRVGSLQIRRDLFARHHEVLSSSATLSNPQNLFSSYTTQRPSTTKGQQSDSLTSSFSFTSISNLRPQYRGKHFVSRVRKDCFNSIFHVMLALIIISIIRSVLLVCCNLSSGTVSV